MSVTPITSDQQNKRAKTDVVKPNKFSLTEEELKDELKNYYGK